MIDVCRYIRTWHLEARSIRKTNPDGWFKNECHLTEVYLVDEKYKLDLYFFNLKDYPKRWITWLVGRWRTQLIARQLVNCRTHEHRHFERTLRSWDFTPGPLLAEGRILLKDCSVFFRFIERERRSVLDVYAIVYLTRRSKTRKRALTTFPLEASYGSYERKRDDVLFLYNRNARFIRGRLDSIRSSYPMKLYINLIDVWS